MPTSKGRCVLNSISPLHASRATFVISEYGSLPNSMRDLWRNRWTTSPRVIARMILETFLLPLIGLITRPYPLGPYFTKLAVSIALVLVIYRKGIILAASFTLEIVLYFSSFVVVFKVLCKQTAKRARYTWSLSRFTTQNHICQKLPSTCDTVFVDLRCIVWMIELAQPIAWRFVPSCRLATKNVSGKLYFPIVLRVCKTFKTALNFCSNSLRFDRTFSTSVGRSSWKL